MTQSRFQPLAMANHLLQLQIDAAVTIASLQTATMVRLTDNSMALTRSMWQSRNRAALLDAMKDFRRDAQQTSTELMRGYTGLTQKQCARTMDILLRRDQAPADTATATSAEPQQKTLPRAAAAVAPSRSAPTKAAPAPAPAEDAPQAKRESTQPRQAVKKTAESAASFHIFSDQAGASRFKLVTADGRTLLTSRGYQDEKSARRGIAAVVKNAAISERYERKEGSEGAGFCELRAGNNRVLCTSAQFKTSKALEAAIEEIARSVQHAEIAD